jgi:hypothetical protein
MRKDYFGTLVNLKDYSNFIKAVNDHTDLDNGEINCDEFNKCVPPRS